MAALPTPSRAQRRWLRRGLDQPGGKLPLFDRQGQEVPDGLVRACVEAGWAEPWFANPLKPDWQVCRLTDAGRSLAESGGDDAEEAGGDPGDDPVDPLDKAETVEDILDVLREESGLDYAEDPAAALAPPEPELEPETEPEGEPKLF